MTNYLEGELIPYTKHEDVKCTLKFRALENIIYMPYISQVSFFENQVFRDAT